MNKFFLYPEWLSPVIIPGLPFRWYGVMYLVAFAITYMLVLRQARQEKLAEGPDEILNMFFWSILGLLIGGRLFAVLFYSPGGAYLRRPWLIFWPFQNGAFVGIQGMSYHGGLVGVIVGAIAYMMKRKLSVLEWCDRMCAAVPLGYTFGRLGNFINAELYGRATARRIGMLFPNATKFPTSERWVRELASEVGIPIAEGENLVNLPRHPSQLYEAFFEGVFLWAILWFVIRKWNPFKGLVFASYLIGYGVVRFFIEYLRQPDEGIGFVVQLSQLNNPIGLFLTPLNFSLGQVFCFLMVVTGIAMIVVFHNRHKKESLLVQK